MTSNWGPNLWYLLHSLSSSYPDKPTKLTITKYKIFMRELIYVIPCPMCQKEYMLYIRRFPVKLGSNSEFNKWIFDFHNGVNKRLGKPTMSYEACLSKYISVNHIKNIDSIAGLSSYHFVHIQSASHFLNWLQAICTFYPELQYRERLHQMYIRYYNRAVKMIKTRYIGMLPRKYKLRQ